MENGPTKIGVHIKCQSIEKSLQFYLALGFNPVFAYGSDEFRAQFSFPTAPEKYQGVSFAIGDALFEIADGHVAVKPEVFGQSVSSSKVSAYFDIASVDQFVTTCRQNNINILVEPRIFPWGTREVVVKDPDGFILVFREVLPTYGK
jgi:catechol 2,3-dioxygenase-like lactoylglutathione lyase family enzyme